MGLSICPKCGSKNNYRARAYMNIAEYREGKRGKIERIAIEGTGYFKCADCGHIVSPTTPITTSLTSPS